MPECHVPSEGSRAARNRLMQRAKLVQDRTRVVNRLHNLGMPQLRPDGAGSAGACPQRQL